MNTTERVKVTVVGGGYNYSHVDKLVTEEYPRWRSEHIQFVHEDTDVRMYFDYPFSAEDPVLKPAKCSIAVLEEPYFVVPEFNHFIYHNSHLFDVVYTNQPGLLDLGRPNIRFYPGGWANISPQDSRMYEKSGMISAIFSQKNYAEGHKLRQQIRNDLFFRGHSCVTFVNSDPHVENSYMDKVSLISPYRFNIAIENEFNTLFTQQLIDCFLTGTIPIYKGSKRINEYFNMKGIILFDTIEELRDIANVILVIGEQMYNAKLQARQENLEIAKRLTNVGDILWTHGLEDILKQKGVI